MEDYQKRVLNERDELGIKIVKLTQFVYSENFTVLSQEEQERMQKQLFIMLEYGRVLCERISAFG